MLRVNGLAVKRLGIRCKIAMGCGLGVSNGKGKFADPSWANEIVRAIGFGEP